MATEFRFNFRLNTPVTDTVHQAFTEMLQQQQMTFNIIAADRMKMQHRLDQINKENVTLRAANQKFREEAQRWAQTAQAQSQAQNGAASHALMQARGVGGAGAKENFRLESRISIHEAPVHSVAMSKVPDPAPGAHRIVATASWDATVKLYDLTSKEIIRTLGGPDAVDDGRMGGLYSVAFAKTQPDILGCTSCDRAVYLWNHTNGKLIKKLQGHTDEVNGIDFHTSQQVMCTASDDCKVIIWDFAEGITLRTLDKHTKAAYGCTFLGNENQYLIATCCFDQYARVFDMRDKSVVSTMELHRDDVIGINYSENKNLLATGSDDGLIGIWDVRTWKLSHQIDTKSDLGIQDNEVKRVSFSPDGSQLAAACSSGRVLVYDVTAGTPHVVANLEGHMDCVFDVTWSTCPQTRHNILVSASHDKTCRYWRQIS